MSQQKFPMNQNRIFLSLRSSVQLELNGKHQTKAVRVRAACTSAIHPAPRAVSWGFQNNLAVINQTQSRSTTHLSIFSTSKRDDQQKQTASEQRYLPAFICHTHAAIKCSLVKHGPVIDFGTLEHLRDPLEAN